ncbi:MAG TPA: hypothetical protein VL793_13295, partial [Patescibacteria group bacterium]|nr:hypothetical protein [Patescibacteria group bacterium]
MVQPFPGEGGHGCIHQFGLHAAIITFLSHGRRLSNRERHREPQMVTFLVATVAATRNAIAARRPSTSPGFPFPDRRASPARLAAFA